MPRSFDVADYLKTGTPPPPPQVEPSILPVEAIGGRRARKYDLNVTIPAPIGHGRPTAIDYKGWSRWSAEGWAILLDYMARHPVQRTVQAACNEPVITPTEVDVEIEEDVQHVLGSPALSISPLTAGADAEPTLVSTLNPLAAEYVAVGLGLNVLMECSVAQVPAPQGNPSPVLMERPAHALRPVHSQSQEANPRQAHDSAQPIQRPHPRSIYVSFEDEALLGPNHQHGRLLLDAPKNNYGRISRGFAAVRSFGAVSHGSMALIEQSGMPVFVARFDSSRHGYVIEAFLFEGDAVRPGLATERVAPVPRENHRWREGDWRE